MDQYRLADEAPGAAQLVRSRTGSRWGRGVADTAAGRRKYLDYLAWMSKDAEGQRRVGFDRMCKGWAFGSRDFKKALLKDHGLLEAALRSALTPFF